MDQRPHVGLIPRWASLQSQKNSNPRNDIIDSIGITAVNLLIFNTEVKISYLLPNGCQAARRNITSIHVDKKRCLLLLEEIHLL